MEIAADPPETGEPGGTGVVDHPASAEVLATVVAAESVLSKRFGARIRLAEPEDLGGSERSIVLRVKVAASPFSLPRTLAVKRYVERPDTGSRDSWVREAVSYQLFTALAAEDRMCPELFAHDRGTSLLVLEDLGRAPTLAEKLHGDDARVAEGALLSWARSLGRLHASTAGREADFDALLRRLSPPKSKDPLTVDGPIAVEALPLLLRTEYGVATSDAALDAARATLALLDTARHRAFSPSDSCPDNNLITNRGVRFLDFEGGCVRNILFDAAYLTVPFPSCWCAYSLPPGMTDAMLAAWRAEIRVMWPDLDDDEVLLPRLLDAQVFWVWLTTWQYLTVPDVEQLGSGGAVARPHQADVLVARWAGLAAAARRAKSAAVAEHAESVVTALTRRFGERSLPLYPAFD
ncbi:hypothetical protein V5P93_001854 [Actinokineospora auranticolor]|uniref:Phosphotransferase family enzyme n=1 Tax=Actinokineospora auranticolor TaxID=155976 RepID=A0A2S6GFL3_9PSEU|nr:hypothetical protein [Actinokineospora auranticolor]PPK63936.1 hypothetical protein CLV40_12356 [Actinokineospora auranticolor]